MKKSFIPIICILLAAALTSCGVIVIHFPGKTGGDETAETELTTEAETDAVTGEPYSRVVKDTEKRAEEYLATIEDADNGYGVVKIASTLPALSEPDRAPQIVSTAVEERNALVEEKLKVKLYTQATDTSSLFAELSSSAKSGMYYADMLMIPQSAVASFAASGLLFNLRSLPRFDVNAPYFNSSSVEAGSAGYGSYALAGDATANPYLLYGMFFNAERLAAVGAESPYDLVRRGRWTMDAAVAMTVEAADVNVFVTGRMREGAVDAAYAGMGGVFMSSGVKKYPAVAVNTDSVDLLVEKIRPLFCHPSALTRDAGSVETFIASGLFMIDRLDALYKIATAGTTCGIVPLPKASEEQENYITLAADASQMIALPSVLLSDERSSQVLRALCAAAVGRIPESYIEYTQNTMLRDNDSALMLDIIMSNIRYDFIFTVATMYPDTQNATTGALRSAVLDWNSASSLVNAYRNSCESVLAAAFPMD